MNKLIVPVTFNLEHWSNLTIDQLDGATIVNQYGDMPLLLKRKDFGLFGGILNRLPPELRRAGRDVLQTTRRNLPIGRITGGKYFHHF